MDGKSIAPKNSPGLAAAEQGVVLLDGPDGVAVSMTPDCAESTAESLKQAATEARMQMRMEQPR